MKYTRIAFNKQTDPATGQHTLSDPQIIPGDVPEIELGVEFLEYLTPNMLTDKEGRHADWVDLRRGKIYIYGGVRVKFHSERLGYRTFTVLDLLENN